MTSRDYRARAREMLAGKWGRAVLVTLLAALLGGLLTSGAVSFTYEQEGEVIHQLPKAVRIYLLTALSIGSTLGIVRFILGGVVQLGYGKYLLKLHDGEEGEVGDLFSQFHRFGDGFILSLLTALYVFLWSLLFVIPGIVAAYKYAMAPLILLENPGMKPNEAITASKQLMYGHKGELFILELSFIGWMLLNRLTLGIGTLWLNPYMNASYAAFYRNISRPTVRAYNPAEPQNPWEA